MSCYEYQLPGNCGGETLREYCGLPSPRVVYAFKRRRDKGRISAQRLFHRNPNPGWDPYHLGRLENILDGERLVHAPTRRALEMDMDVARRNEHHPWYRVAPRRVTLEIRPSYVNQKEGDAK